MKFVRSLRWPPVADRPFVAAGAAVWLGVAASTFPALIGVVGGLFLAILGVRRRWDLTLGGAILGFAAGCVVGLVAAAGVASVQSAELPTGEVDLVGVALADPRSERFGEAVAIEVLEMVPTPPNGLADVRLVLRAHRIDVEPGELVLARNALLRNRPGWHRGQSVTGSASVDEVTVVAGTTARHLEWGNALRGRVVDALSHRRTQAEALTRGFLIGDISDLGAVEQEELRRSGLTHFVAVSGGNVALFLGGVWILMMPLGLGVQTRAAVGLLALVLFVVMTRWEPSVVRAASMAALVLLGRIAGLPVDPWRAVGGGIAAALLVAPQLASSPGFHLSAAATCGLILTSRLAEGRRPLWLWRGLVASTAAQVSVLPLLLMYFGSVPLVAPLANVVAAPIVSAATIVSGVGVLLANGTVVDGGVAVANLVLDIARIASHGPQLGAWGAGAAILLGVSLALPRTRPLAVGCAAVGLLLGATQITPVVADAVTVLDVGQGDAVLIRGADGVVVAVDTGPDPVAYQRALRRNGVQEIDLLVITHGDADHVGGASGLMDRIEVGALWLPGRAPQAELVSELERAAMERGVAVAVPTPGTMLAAGGIQLTVMGPHRRFDAENDESITLWLEGPGRSMLLAGDIEAVAQRELPELEPDVLLVPHHGSATTDLGWLIETLGEVAIVSVGDNSYGHPAPAVLEVLTEADVEVFITGRDGDVVVRLG